MASTKEDFLDVDPDFQGQKFVCLSFVSPESVFSAKSEFFVQKFLEYKKLNSTEFEDFVKLNEIKLEEAFQKTQNGVTTVRGVKVRGTFATEEEARRRAKSIQSFDSKFNVFVAPVGYWLPWDPSTEHIDDQEYAENQLNTLMKKYKENQKEKDDFYQKQVRERIEQAKLEGVELNKNTDETTSPSPSELLENMQ